MNIKDLNDSPYSKSEAKNGFDCVSRGLVILKTDNPKIQLTPHCINHGAMNKMDANGLWRCIACNAGCYGETLIF